MLTGALRRGDYAVSAPIPKKVVTGSPQSWGGRGAGFCAEGTQSVQKRSHAERGNEQEQAQSAQ